MTVRLAVTELVQVSREDETVSVRVCERFRGDTVITMDVSNARWLLASLLDMRTNGELGEYDA